MILYGGYYIWIVGFIQE